MPQLHLLRVFCAADNSAGNPLAVFLDGGEVPPPERQGVAADLGLSETVFVDDQARGELRIFTPATEFPFAGHPTVGTAWLLAELGKPVEVLRVPAGEVLVRRANGDTFVRARPEWAPPFELERLVSAADVESLDGPPGGRDLVAAWAWLDEAAGAVCSRVFLDRHGVPEDEATGAAAVMLCAELGRPLEIRQGHGSRLLARPSDDGFVEVGGRTVLDEVTEYSLGS